MSQHIHCIVSDCHYYAQGNRCNANEILVSTDDFAVKQPDNVDCTMAKQLTPVKAGNCTATACKTYVSKGSGDIRADGVQKMS
ncbi:MAG: hypothetical protein VR69_04410 [Peptococcaceae bacterium BRH_c4b]|nr:MAG: hypothetical protein VR69_04410 [Peptococcaceae bacterium BRH_c4b]